MPVVRSAGKTARKLREKLRTDGTGGPGRTRDPAPPPSFPAMPPLDPRHVRRIAAGALLLIAPHAAAAQPGTPGDLWLMRARADSLFAARQMAPAESLYRAVARHDSTDFLLLQRLATAQLTLGKHREGRALLARTFRDGPNQQEVALALARAAAQDGDNRAALDWLDSAVA